MIYWFTGQPAAGKTTLANWLAASFPTNKATIIDGDDIREIFDNKDYSELGRRKNIELAQKIAQFLNKKGEIAIVSLVSPYRDQREEFKQKMGTDEPPLENFIDIDTTNDREFQSIQKIREKLGL